MLFRVHHILCTSLYQGFGYDGPFCENMTQRVNYLREHPTEKLTLVTNPDVICENCPNLNREDQTCSGDHNHVHIKDVELLEALQLEENAEYSFRELLLCGKERITKEIFDASCGNCLWYKQGLCSHEDFVKNIDKYVI